MRFYGTIVSSTDSTVVIKKNYTQEDVDNETLVEVIRAEPITRPQENMFWAFLRRFYPELKSGFGYRTVEQVYEDIKHYLNANKLFQTDGEFSLSQLKSDEFDEFVDEVIVIFGEHYGIDTSDFWGDRRLEVL
jgi:hypothetical protein